MIHTKIISGFPGIGKTTAIALHPTALDSDSSHFSWFEPGKRHPAFPSNYMEHIKSNIGKVPYIFVSSHDVVRAALPNHEIPYTLVYPDRSLKEEYLGRYQERGSDENFLMLMNAKWDDFIDSVERETVPRKIVLQSGQYLVDVLDEC